MKYLTFLLFQIYLLSTNLAYAQIENKPIWVVGYKAQKLYDSLQKVKIKEMRLGHISNFLKSVEVQCLLHELVPNNDSFASCSLIDHNDGDRKLTLRDDRKTVSVVYKLFEALPFESDITWVGYRKRAEVSCIEPFYGSEYLCDVIPKVIF